MVVNMLGLHENRVRVLFKQKDGYTVYMYGVASAGFGGFAPTRELAHKMLRDDLKARGMRMGDQPKFICANGDM